MRSAERWQFIDLPNERKVHQEAIPRVGGIAMGTGVVISMLLWLSMQKVVVALLLGLVVILIFGVWDDRKDLNYKIKFLGQFIAVGVVIVMGGVKIAVLPFLGIEPVTDYIAIPLTIFFMLGVTNAINLSDGLDGLAGGSTLIILGVLAAMAYHVGDLVVVVIALAIIGSILGFLRFNTHPARIFMGDGGSQFLGFSVAVLAVMLTQNPEVAISPALPLLLLGLPILDTLTVMVTRMAAGRSPFAPDKNHFHHKLLEFGLDHYESVFVLYLIQALVVLLAYSLRYEGDEIIVGAYLLFSVTVLTAFYLPRRLGWKFRSISGSHAVKQSIHARASTMPAVSAQKMWHVSMSVVTVIVAGYLLFGVMSIDNASPDIGLISAIAVLFFLGSGFTRGRYVLAWMERGGLYVVSASVVYLVQSAESLPEVFNSLETPLFIALTLAIIVALRFSSHKKFEITTHDFIVIFIAFVIPSIPNSFISDVRVGEFIAKLIVLFYAIELMLVFLNRYSGYLRLSVFLLFCAMGWRAID